MIKLVLIGAGSAMFTQGLIVDLIFSPQLDFFELALVDIDLAALDMAEKVAVLLIDRMGAVIKLTAATEDA